MLNSLEGADDQYTLELLCCKEPHFTFLLINKLII